MSNMSSLQQINRYEYCFTEVMSSFFERVCLDYLIKNKIYEDDAHRCLNLNYYDLYNRLYRLYDVSNIAMEDNLIYDDENIVCKEKLDSDDNIDKYGIYLYNYMDDINYGYGTLLGEYFFNIYRQDKKEGLKQIRDFLSKQALLDERELLDTIDFFDNEYSFLNPGLRENVNYMRKRYKW